MVLVQSPYPAPPSVPNENIHHCLFNTPEQDKIPDYVLHIDGLTGRQRTFYEFRDIVFDGAAALSAPVSSGGLGLDPKRDIVGIFSHNCMVSNVL